MTINYYIYHELRVTRKDNEKTFVLDVESAHICCNQIVNIISLSNLFKSLLTSEDKHFEIFESLSNFNKNSPSVENIKEILIETYEIFSYSLRTKNEYGKGKEFSDLLDSITIDEKSSDKEHYRIMGGLKCSYSNEFS